MGKTIHPGQVLQNAVELLKKVSMVTNVEEAIKLIEQVEPVLTYTYDDHLLKGPAHRIIFECGCLFDSMEKYEGKCPVHNTNKIRIIAKHFFECGCYFRGQWAPNRCPIHDKEVQLWSIGG